MRELNPTKKKRWVSLYVENRIGVLARISGMMSGKSYNVERCTIFGGSFNSGQSCF